MALRGAYLGMAFFALVLAGCFGPVSVEPAMRHLRAMEKLPEGPERKRLLAGLTEELSDGSYWKRGVSKHDRLKVARRAHVVAAGLDAHDAEVRSLSSLALHYMDAWYCPLPCELVVEPVVRQWERLLAARDLGRLEHENTPFGPWNMLAPCAGWPRVRALARAVLDDPELSAAAADPAHRHSVLGASAQDSARRLLDQPMSAGESRR